MTLSVLADHPVSLASGSSYGRLMPAITIARPITASITAMIVRTMVRFLFRARQAEVISSPQPPIQIGYRWDHARPYFQIPVPAMCMTSENTPYPMNPTAAMRKTQVTAGSAHPRRQGDHSGPDFPSCAMAMPFPGATDGG